MAAQKKQKFNAEEKPIAFDPERSVFAAGAVLYRMDDAAGLTVAVVHRPRYDDWSLPKGKVDEGETLSTAAVRELEEETGHRSILGQYIGTSSYQLTNGAKKSVWYWAARSTGGEFVPSDECEALEWLPVADATERVSYELDERVLARFAEIAEPHAATVRQVILVRHARAGNRAKWKGDDLLRPLDRKGMLQAEFLVPQLESFGVSAVVSAEPVRCVQSVEPIADKLGVEIEIDESIGDIAAEADPDSAAATILAYSVHGSIDGKGAIRVLSSQGTAIPLALERLAEGTDLAGRDFSTKKGGQWTLSFSGGKLVGADYLQSPLPRT
ncbi:NUDIX hydrolase [Dietzia sp.]|uniref:NUDIX hydrolase n=1 Tax=Dietzia sp. TaxID=1871616 RepID=UPI002FD97B0A